MYRVARNRAIDAMRARGSGPGTAARDDAGSAVTDEAADPGPSPVQEAVARERAAVVRRALEMLPPKERDVLLLRYFGDLKFSEIARIRRRPLGTVLWQVTRSLEKIRLLLTDKNNI